jgi:hypothetical protein
MGKAFRRSFVAHHCDSDGSGPPAATRYAQRGTRNAIRRACVAEYDRRNNGKGPLFRKIKFRYRNLLRRHYPQHARRNRTECGV